MAPGPHTPLAVSRREVSTARTVVRRCKDELGLVNLVRLQRATLCSGPGEFVAPAVVDIASFAAKKLNRIRELIAQYSGVIRDAWDEHCGRA